MEQMLSIYEYCFLEKICYPCFKEDQQDPLKLYLGLCHLCDKELWETMKSSMPIHEIIAHMNNAPKEWIELFEEELKARS
jgi:hypothetical protein